MASTPNDENGKPPAAPAKSSDAGGSIGKWLEGTTPATDEGAASAPPMSADLRKSLEEEAEKAKEMEEEGRKEEEALKEEERQLKEAKEKKEKAGLAVPPRKGSVTDWQKIRYYWYCWQILYY